MAKIKLFEMYFEGGRGKSNDQEPINRDCITSNVSGGCSAADRGGLLLVSDGAKTISEHRTNALAVDRTSPLEVKIFLSNVRHSSQFESDKRPL